MVSVTDFLIQCLMCVCVSPTDRLSLFLYTIILKDAYLLWIHPAPLTERNYNKQAKMMCRFDDSTINQLLLHPPPACTLHKNCSTNQLCKNYYQICQVVCDN